MGFIDADKLIKKMTQNCPFVLDTTTYDSVYGIPIVEAIPVEWIKTWLAKRDPYDDCIYDMLLDWEAKEHAID